MTKAEREMMERIHAYGIILSLDEEQAGLVLARIKKMLAEQEAEAKLLLYASCAKSVAAYTSVPDCAASGKGGACRSFPAAPSS